MIVIAFQVGVKKGLAKDLLAHVVLLKEIAMIPVMEMVNVVKMMVLGRVHYLVATQLQPRRLLQQALLVVRRAKVGTMAKISRMDPMDFVAVASTIVLDFAHLFQVIRICALEEVSHQLEQLLR